MAPQKTTGDDVLPRQVNHILQNLRGEHFRHARNVQRKPVSSAPFSSHAHNQPTLPINLIYGSPAPAPSPSWVPGPSPPRSWRSPATPTPSSTLVPARVKNDTDVTPNTPTWRERALSLFFADVPSSPSSGHARSRLVYPDHSPIPRLTLLCLQLIWDTCPAADLAHVASYVPHHLRRALLRYTAIHAPLSQTELDALCEGTMHVGTELIIVGPRNTLRRSVFRKKDPPTGAQHHDIDDTDEPERGDGKPGEPWDAVQAQSNEPLALRSLAVLSSSLNAATVLAFPPTITHLALVNIPQRIPLRRLPLICPLLVLFDLSYNAWLYSSEGADGRAVLEEVEWCKLRKLEVLGLRGCLVTQRLLLGLNRGRWEDVRVIR